MKSRFQLSRKSNTETSHPTECWRCVLLQHQSGWWGQVDGRGLLRDCEIFANLRLKLCRGLTILVCLCHSQLSGPSMDHERTLNWKLPHSTAILQHLSIAMLLDFNFREAFKKKHNLANSVSDIMTPRTHYLR